MTCSMLCCLQHSLLGWLLCTAAAKMHRDAASVLQIMRWAAVSFASLIREQTVFGTLPVLSQVHACNVPP